MFTNIQLRYQAQLVVASILLLLPGEKIGILMRLENKNTSHISIVSSAKRPFDKCWWNFLTPPSAARGGLKENGQNPDSGSKKSENQNNYAIL